MHNSIIKGWRIMLDLKLRLLIENNGALTEHDNCTSKHMEKNENQMQKKKIITKSNSITNDSVINYFEYALMCLLVSCVRKTMQLATIHRINVFSFTVEIVFWKRKRSQKSFLRSDFLFSMHFQAISNQTIECFNSLSMKAEFFKKIKKSTTKKKLIPKARLITFLCSNRDFVRHTFLHFIIIFSTENNVNALEMRFHLHSTNKSKNPKRIPRHYVSDTNWEWHKRKPLTHSQCIVKQTFVKIVNKKNGKNGARKTIK